MGQLDLTRHIKWSADDDFYYGSIETVGPAGVIGTLEAKISRPWVYETAMAIRKRLMQTAPRGVNVGAWTNLSDPARFRKLCQSVANERVKAQIVEKYKRQGVTPMPWFGPWTLVTADAAYELVVAAQAGDEAALAQLDRIRAHAESGEPRAMEALAKINAVAKLVVKGLPKPSILAQHMMLRPASAQLALPPARPRRPARRLPELPPQEFGEPEDENEPEDPEEITHVNPSEDEIEFGADLGWIANQFVSVDGARWSWSGEGGTDKIVGEVRTLKSLRGGTLTLSKGELLELIKEGELTPISGAEVAGLSPEQKAQVGVLGARSRARGKVLRQQRSAPKPKGGVPSSKGAPARRPPPPTGKKVTAPPAPPPPPSPAGTTSSTTGTATVPMLAPRLLATSKAPLVAPVAAAAAAAAAAASTRVPGLLYPGDYGYPLTPGMPGYGSPVAGNPYSSVPQGYPGGGGGDMGSSGGGGGGGGGEFPDEGAQGGDGGGDMAGSFDAPDVLDDDLPTDGDGNVVFPEEDEQPMDGAQYAEEVSQSTDGSDVAAGATDDGGPDVFPDEGAQPAGPR